MADDYVTLSKEDRLEALSVAATASGRRVHLLERDCLGRPDARCSLSFRRRLEHRLQGWHLTLKSIRSDQTLFARHRRDHDIRRLLPEFAKGDTPLPENNAQEKKWRELIDERLPACALRPNTAQKITDDLKCIVHEKYVRPCSRSLFTLELR